MLSDSSNNTAHYKSPAFDKLIADTLKVADDTQRSELYAKAEQQLDKDSAIVPVYYYVNARPGETLRAGIPVKTRWIIFM